MTVLFVAKIYCWTIKQVHKPLHQHNVDSGKGSTRRTISGNQRYQSDHALQNPIALKVIDGLISRNEISKKTFYYFACYIVFLII